ncbi:hypothetical protein [Brevibacillus sp. SIMBA_040]|uniref:hypothetical protein n=1 Tax=unclassified Brevibacillus TaxID=2684853 RepID=UPI00397DD9D3
MSQTVGGMNRLPMERAENTSALFAVAQAAASELGLSLEKQASAVAATATSAQRLVSRRWTDLVLWAKVYMPSTSISSSTPSSFVLLRLPIY